MKMMLEMSVRLSINSGLICSGNYCKNCAMFDGSLQAQYLIDTLVEAYDCLITFYN